MTDIVKIPAIVEELELALKNGLLETFTKVARLGEEFLSKLTKDDLADANKRKAVVLVTALVARAQDAAEALKSAPSEKPEEKANGPQTIGFMDFKKAA